ncbi:SGNH/GDSL hydrolase family protein [uncultured Chitinophaga sp.]|uniref:SGNH/GDSL hydrolase family protein n=1 Tax=uncultured Chitinophaga sp. TaxID=339340 RepID=UPI0025E63E82|nr:SGNH/GDSL hydrolase family protein [uncultured Chitinophaga sp.]
MQRRKFISASFLGAAALTIKVPAFAGHAGAAEVINAGIGGNNTADLLKRMQKDCLDHKPSLTVLMCGTNDMNSMKYIPLQQYKQNMAQIITAVKSTGSQVVVMTILPFIEEYLFTRHPPAHYGDDGPMGRRAQVNETIKALAAEHKTYLLDLGAIFDRIGNVGKNSDSLIMNEANSQKTDGVHPTSTGYRFISLAVYDFIKYNKLKTGKIVCFGDSITNGGGGNASYPAHLKKLLEG